MPVPLPFQRVAQYGYDLAHYPKPLYLDWSVWNPGSVSVGNSAIADFTLSPNTLAGYNTGGISTTGLNDISNDGFPSAIMNDTNLTLVYEANDTEFSASFDWYPPTDVIVDRLLSNFAVGLIESAHSAGSFGISSVRFLVDVFKRNETEKITPPMNVTATGGGVTGLAANGANGYCIYNFIKRDPFIAYAGGKVRFQIVATISTGTGTYQNGIMPIFPYHSTGGMRSYFKSGCLLHTRPIVIEGGNLIMPTEYAKFVGQPR